MRTTLDIRDTLLQRAKEVSKLTGRPLNALVEEGLRHVLEKSSPVERYRMPDRSVGEPGGPNPLEGLSWQDLREDIYGTGTS